MKRTIFSGLILALFLGCKSSSTSPTDGNTGTGGTSAFVWDTTLLDYLVDYAFRCGNLVCIVMNDAQANIYVLKVSSDKSTFSIRNTNLSTIGNISQSPLNTNSAYAILNGNLYEITENGENLIMQSPPTGITDIVESGGFIYLSKYIFYTDDTLRIYKIDPNSGSILNTFKYYYPNFFGEITILPTPDNQLLIIDYLQSTLNIKKIDVQNGNIVWEKTETVSIEHESWTIFNNKVLFIRKTSQGVLEILSIDNDGNTATYTINDAFNQGVPSEAKPYYTTSSSIAIPYFQQTNDVLTYNLKLMTVDGQGNILNLYDVYENIKNVNFTRFFAVPLADGFVVVFSYSDTQSQTDKTFIGFIR